MNMNIEHGKETKKVVGGSFLSGRKSVLCSVTFLLVLAAALLICSLSASATPTMVNIPVQGRVVHETNITWTGPILVCLGDTQLTDPLPPGCREMQAAGGLFAGDIPYSLEDPHSLLRLRVYVPSPAPIDYPTVQPLINKMFYPAGGPQGDLMVNGTLNVTNSVAVGNYATASGPNSIAAGTGANAAGANSFAVGNVVYANALNSFALGYNAITNGESSIAMGDYVTANGAASVAMGSNTVASGLASTATGQATRASANYATAMGISTNASGEASTAMGRDSQSSGIVSTAFGQAANAQGDYSIAGGFSANALSIGAIALGNGAYAYGDNSISLGSNTQARGNNSVAIGSSTTATGASSTAIGINIDCQQENATCIGGGNVGIGTGTPNQRLEVIGNANIAGNLFANNICYSNGTNCYATSGYGSNESKFYKKTAATSTGNLVFPGKTGYDAGNALCNSEFPGTHMCTQDEVIRSVHLMDISSNPDWNGEAWVSSGAAKYSPASLPCNDCNGWTWGVSGSYLGNWWHFNQTNGGDGRTGHCGNTLALACCK